MNQDHAELNRCKIGYRGVNAAMLKPHFWNFVGNNRILAAAATVRANWGRIRFGSFQSPG